jgi:hypothetical protein
MVVLCGEITLHLKSERNRDASGRLDYSERRIQGQFIAVE